MTSDLLDRRRGTVWLAVDDGRPGRRTGYWDLEPDGPPTMLEEGPGWNRPEDAVAWGRRRAARVYLRLDVVSGYRGAGDGDPPEGSDVEVVYRP